MVLENNGIGYKIFTTPKVLELPMEARAELHTYLQVREDALQLFGFENAEDLHFFEQLITVSGVGPKVALAVLSAGSVEITKQAIAAGDAAVFTKIGGVGKKTAEKIILELKEKISAPDFGAEGGVSRGLGDIFSALETLGYTGREIKKVLPEIDAHLPEEEKIKQALRILGKK